MTSRSGQRIVTLHPGIDLSLQDALLSAIEGVLADAGVERLWIQPSPEHDLRVYGELPVPAEGADVIPLDAAAQEQQPIEVAPIDVVSHVSLDRSDAASEMA